MGSFALHQSHTARHAAVPAAVWLLFAATLAFASGGKTRGRSLANTTQACEFYLAFPQNIVDPGVSPNVLDLTIFVASNYNTTGDLQILGLGNAIVWDTTFTVDSQSVTTISIPHRYNLQTEIQDGENEQVIRKAVHITTAQPAMVYGMSHRPYTADSYLAIPPGSWGKDYRVASYYGVTTTNAVDAKLNATAEFALVAKYDSTRVSILLSAPTRNTLNNMTHQAGDNVEIVMNAGDVYQMQAYTDPYFPKDLSMSEIQSSKPVGVIAGSKCADVPPTYWACDYIVEMIPPIETWGKEYFTFPFDTRRTGGDIWRVYPSQDNTTITIDDSVAAAISPTDSTPWYEIDDLHNPKLKTAAHWTFDKPAMMVQYITGEQYDGSDTNGTNYGDPSDAVLQPREQFGTDMLYATPPDSFGYIPRLGGAQFVNVFIDGTNGSEDSLFIDGYPVNNLPLPKYFLSSSAAVPGTNFWLYHIQVPGGIHHFSAPAPFTAYAAGFKSYESYAAPCALTLDVVGKGDTKPPALAGTLACGTLVTTLADMPPVDSIRTNLAQAGGYTTGIGWLTTGPYPDTTYNFDANIFATDANFMPGDSAATVKIHVTNLRNSAHGALYLVDRAGNDTTIFYDYTPDSVTATPETITLAHPFGGADTATIIVQNPISRPVRVDSVWMKAGERFRIDNGQAFPVTLAPGEFLGIGVRFFWTLDTMPSAPVRDTVMIGFDCFSRPLATAVAMPPSGVGEAQALPGSIALSQNAPNPFADLTLFHFTLPTAERTRLEIYDALGRSVAALANGVLPAGEHTARFDATGLPAGVYIARLRAGGAEARQMMLLAR